VDTTAPEPDILALVGAVGISQFYGNEMKRPYFSFKSEITNKRQIASNRNI
jgi:hypothetical protein